MSEHRMRLDDKDLARIELALLKQYKRKKDDMSYKEKMRERTFMGKFRRTRLHDMSGRHSGDYVPVDMDGMNGDPPYEVDIDEYMAELEEALES